MRALAASVVAAWVPAPAVACGGFFCNQEGVDQSKERIVFEVDEEKEEVSAHVQIFYQGSSMEFAWVLPVASVPELFVSTDQMFTTLDQLTRPNFYLAQEYDGDCQGEIWYEDEADFDGAPSSGTADSGGGGGVTVVSEQQVGPYETAILQADSSAELLTWLQDNSYFLPSALQSALDPYVAGGQYFVALRLQNDKSAGDIAPLGMRYTGTAASIPIQLTSIAATPDMRLEVYMMGDKRAVPSNYLHVQINDAAIDWLNWGSNYDDVITMAADEAGGQAFATDYAGSTSGFLGSMYKEGRWNLDAVRAVTDPVDVMNQIIWQGFPSNAQMMTLLQTYIPKPASLSGLEDRDFYNCLECYESELDGLVVDSDAFADDLDELIVQPLVEAEDMLVRNTWITRLTSSMSPEEMTADPMFVLNADMDEVSNQHKATLIYECGTGDDALDVYDAPRRLELSDGRIIMLPSMRWLHEHGMTGSELLEALQLPAALIIEQTSENGLPIPLTDNNTAVDGNTDDFNDFVNEINGTLDDGAVGCGCDATGGGALSLLWLSGLVAAARRRRES